MQHELPLIGDASRIKDDHPVIGIRVRLDRHVDRLHGCHDNIALILPGRGPHAAQLRCAQCNRHRGWLAQTTFNFISETVRVFGVPSEPFTLPDASHANAGTSTMDVNKLFPSKFLSAADVGEGATFTIDKVRVEEIGRNGDDKPVMSFIDEAKKLILNKTNSK